MSSAASSKKLSSWLGCASMPVKRGAVGSLSEHLLPGELAELSAVKHNGSAISIEPERGTGSWNWWEISNARIVGEACDRWFERQYQKTRDRLIHAKAYTIARNDREFRLAVARKIAAAKAEQSQQQPQP